MMLNGQKLMSLLHLGNCYPPGQRQARPLPGLNLNRLEARVAPHWALIAEMV